MTDTVIVKGREYKVAPLDPPKSAYPQSALMAITPAVANSWLRFNASNRSVRKDSVNKMARDMATIMWDINGESVKLSRPLLMGEVDDIPVGSSLFMDGQHRFLACIASGTPFVTEVMWGLDPGARLTIDDGAARKASDVFKMEGQKYHTVLATMVRRQMMWEVGDRRFNGQFKPTKQEMVAYYYTDRHAFLRAAEQGWWVREKLRTVGPTVIAQAYYLCSRVSEDQAPWFFSRVRVPVDLSENHPVHALRDRLDQDRYRKLVAVPHQQVAYFLRAWNAYREDRPLSYIVQAVDDPTPDPK